MGLASAVVSFPAAKLTPFSWVQLLTPLRPLPPLWKPVPPLALFDGVAAANWPKVLLLLPLLPPPYPMALPLLRKAVLSLALFDGVAPDVADGVAAVPAVAIGCAGSCAVWRRCRRFRCRSAEDLLHAAAVCDGVAAVVKGFGASGAE